jgi:pyruvate/2-oxoglutarate dehydrogenase complex dihydrolipoamide dehydrogenase (E3) component
LERYDLIVLGGGAAGINAVKAAITLKARVALIDRGPLGGTCVNYG